MRYPDDHELTELFYQVVRQLENLAKSSHKNMNFFSGQYKCLFLLDEAGTITQRQMCIRDRSKNDYFTSAGYGNMYVLDFFSYRNIS